MVRKVVCVKQGYLSETRAVSASGRRTDRAEVSASIVAEKRGNACGAKGRRKVDA